MAQLRQDYQQFVLHNTAIVVVGPENAQSFQAYWHENHLPFIGLPDPEYKILRLYGQEVNLFKFGRLPAQVLVDAQGMVRSAHYGKSMSDIPNNADLFEILADVNQMVG